MLFEVNHMNKNGLAFPLVYSCSGCSSAAQMANYLALQLDRQGEAEMSCIAGVGGNVKNFLITIETQPASTGVVALEPFDSRS